MNGTVNAVYVNALGITLASGVTYIVNLQYGALVTLNGNTCNLSDLLPGDTVSATAVTEPTNIPYVSLVAATRA